MTAVVALLLSFVEVDLLAGSSPTGQGFLLVVLQGALVVAAALGALGLVRPGCRAWRRGVAVGVAVAAAAVPVGGLAWFLTAGQPELDETLDPDIPAYMVQSSELGPEHGILVVRGSVESGLRYTVRREDGIRLGEDEIVAHAESDPAFDARVRALVSRPTPTVVAELAAAGIEYVVLPAPADPDVVRRAGCDRRAGRGQRRGPGHPCVAGRPAAVRRRARRAALVAPDRAAPPPGRRGRRGAGPVRAQRPGEVRTRRRR